VQVRVNDALGRQAAGFLVGSGQSLSIENVNCFVDVSVSFDQGALTLHHASSGALA
jgi:hypothetical protein